MKASVSVSQRGPLMPARSNSIFNRDSQIDFSLCRRLTKIGHLIA